MNRRWQRFLALCLTALLVVTQLQPARAGFGIGGFQIPTSPGDLTNIGKQKAEEAAFEQIAKSLGEVETPLKLDQRTAYKQVQVDNFQPQKLEFTSVQDWLKPLAPGDYWIDLMAFCTQWSIHSPGNGMAYKLAPLQGKSADIISAIFLRGTLHNVNPSELQAIAWRIQAGVSINQWSDGEKHLAHTLIPEYESRLTSDFLDETKAKYESFRGHIPLSVFPSFDEALGRLGTTGQLVSSIKRARQTLTNRSIAADQLPDLLYEKTDGSPRQLPGLANPEPVQWNEVKPGLYASFVVQQGNLGNNRLNIRVTPQAVQASNPDGVRVAGAANMASPSQVSVLDALATAKASPGSFVRNVIVQAARGRIPPGGTFLPESVEAIPVLGELAVTLNIGYAIGQHGAQALIGFLRTPQKSDKPNDNCEKFRKGRAEYEAAVRNLANVEQKLHKAGNSENVIARTLSAMRRVIGIEFKDRTAQISASAAQQIAERNIADYQDPLGPTYEWLRSANGGNKTDEAIIRSASKPGGGNIIPTLEAQFCKE